MSNTSIAHALFTAILAVGVSTTSKSTLAADKTPPVEKCYGIAKKGMNDCAGNSHPCQGQSAKDNDPGEYMLVLEGTCKKIVGGKPEPVGSKQ